MKTRNNQKELGSLVCQTIADHYGYLKGRWMDEKEFEDFAEYEKSMAKKFDKIPGAEFVSMNKRFQIRWVNTEDKCEHEIRGSQGQFTHYRIGAPGDFRSSFRNTENMNNRIAMVASAYGAKIVEREETGVARLITIAFPTEAKKKGFRKFYNNY